MKRFALVALLSLLASPTAALATPSTVIWTPATTYVQPFAVPHITYDSYFNAARAYPIDAGLSVGILPWDKLQAEVGVDVLAPAGPEQVYFNGKLGTPENALFDGMPGITAGIYNAGIQSEDTAKGIVGNQYNVFHGEVGKTFKYVGTLTLGGYYGDDKLLVDAKGNKANAGFMVSWYRPLTELTDKLGVGVDYQSGKNSLGALGAGITVFPLPAAGVIVGYVHFNEVTGACTTLGRLCVAGDETQDMWTLQADVDMDFKAWFADEEKTSEAQQAPAPL